MKRALLIAWIIITTQSQLATLTYYGTSSDGYLGQRHGASWHGDSCGLPDVVDDVAYGVAAPYSVPYCTPIVVCTDRCILVTAVDRMRDDTLFGRPHFDLWSAPAQELGMIEPGIIEGAVFCGERHIQEVEAR